MELYFKEQVFCADRAPYLQRSDPTGCDSDGRGAKPERFVAFFTEKIVVLHNQLREKRATSTTKVTYESLSSKLGQGEPDIIRKVRRGNDSEAGDDASVDFVDDVASNPPETKVFIVLTNASFYIIDCSSLEEAGLVFLDAPMPLLIGEHPLLHLFCCTIFFGFQRFVLTFSAKEPSIALPNHVNSASSDMTDDIPFQIKLADANAAPINFEYLVITREKSRAYAIITRITHMANALRQQLSASILTNESRNGGHVDGNRMIPNVKISNQDSQLLEALQRSSLSLSERLKLSPSEVISCDVLYYQMLYQVTDTADDTEGQQSHLNRTGSIASSVSYGGSGRNSFTVPFPSVSSKSSKSSWGRMTKSKKQSEGQVIHLVARTIIITATTLLLCAEELTRSDVRLVVLDCARLKDLASVTAGPLGDGAEDESANGVVIRFRPRKVFSSRRKWRLCTDSLQLSSRLAEECKRIVSLAGGK